MATNFREHSKSGQWVTSNGMLPTSEQINVGSLQRIADACELMAKNHAQLIADRDRYERYYQEQRGCKEAAQRTILGLRGQLGRRNAEIARLKKELADARG